MTKQKPRLQALILADQYYEDSQTGKRIVAGIFNSLMASEFPATFSQATWAYVSLTDLRGTMKMVLRYRDLTDFSVLMETSALTIESQDPLATLEFGIPIPSFPMPHEGIYSFELYVDEDQLGSVRVTVQKIEEAQP